MAMAAASYDDHHHNTSPSDDITSYDIITSHRTKTFSHIARRALNYRKLKLIRTHRLISHAPHLDGEMVL